MEKNRSRRSFIRNAAAGSAMLTAWFGANRKSTLLFGEAGKPALLGGTPVHSGGWLSWPQWRESWEADVLNVLRSGRWYRGSGGRVAEFVGSSRVDLQACKLEYSIVSPK